MHKGMLFRRVKERFFKRRYKITDKIIDSVIDSYYNMIVDMADKGYIEFFNPKTGENVDFDEASSLYLNDSFKK